MKAIETEYAGYKFRSRIESRHAVFFDTLGIKYQYELEGFELDHVWYLPDFYLPEQQCWIEVKGQEPTVEEIEKADLLAIYTQKPVFIFYGDVWIPDNATKSALGCGPFYLDGVCADYFDLHDRETKQWRLRQEDDNLTEEDFFNLQETQTSCELPVTPHIMALFYKLHKHHIALRVIKGILHIDAPFRSATKPILSLIEEYESELIPLLSYQETWKWELGAIHCPQCRWIECPICHHYGIDSIHTKSTRCQCAINRDDIKSRLYKTPNLVRAYTAARQARFEHGHRGIG